jgi:hypothetical protein
MSYSVATSGRVFVKAVLTSPEDFTHATHLLAHLKPPRSCLYILILKLITFQQVLCFVFDLI